MNSHMAGSKNTAQKDNVKQADPQDWLTEYGDLLYRYALTRVKSPDLAEDLVQDALLSAFKAYERFEGRCSVRTWIVGILRNKIIDHFRATNRRGGEALELEESQVDTGQYFNSIGIWRQFLENWADNPEEIIEKRDFYAVFEKCLSKLPEQSRKAFILKMTGEQDSKEVCNLLQISTSNYWVLLYRARMGLRECIEKNWVKA